MPLSRIGSLLLITLMGATSLYAQGAVEGPLPQLSGAPAQGNTSADAPVQHKLLDNEAIIKMSRADLGDDIILQSVRSQPGDYRTGPDDLVALRTGGVSQAVIAAMLARTRGLQQRATRGSRRAGHFSAPGVATPVCIHCSARFDQGRIRRAGTVADGRAGHQSRGQDLHLQHHGITYR